MIRDKESSKFNQDNTGSRRLLLGSVLDDGSDGFGLQCRLGARPAFADG